MTRRRNTPRVNISKISVCDKSSQSSDGHPDIFKIRFGVIPPEAEGNRGKTPRVNISKISVCDQSSQSSDGHPDIFKIRFGVIPPEAG